MDRRLEPNQGAPRKTTTEEAASWQGLGDFKPCWSDVPFPNYVYDQQKAQAIALGDLALLDGYLRRNGKTLSQLRGALEFGSGLTRGSDWLAHHAGHLTIVDSCLPHLLLTQERLKQCMLLVAGFLVPAVCKSRLRRETSNERGVIDLIAKYFAR